MRHTKGPWFIDGGGVTSDALHAMDCIVEHVYGPKANALLIAAAPDLLESAMSLVANLEEGDFISTTRIDAVKSAIAKAKGQAQ